MIQHVSLEVGGLYSVTEELRGLAVASVVLGRLDLLYTELGTKLRGCQRELWFNSSQN